MGNQTVDVTIIVISWNTKTLLAQCLDSVLQTLGSLTADTIVIDNGSIDGTIELLAREYPWINLIANEANVGFAAANNQAMRLATGRYWLLLNSDAQLQADALKEVVQFMDRTPDAGAAGPRVLNPDGSVQRSWFKHVSPLSLLLETSFLHRHIYDRLLLQRIAPKASCGVDDLSACCMLLRPEAVTSAGLMDENYWMFCEDTDLCIRLREAGWSLYYVPSAEVVHHRGHSVKKMHSPPGLVQFFRSRRRFFRKHYGRAAVCLLTVLGVLDSLLRMGIFGILSIHPNLRRQAMSDVVLGQQLLREALGFGPYELSSTRDKRE